VRSATLANSPHLGQAPAPPSKEKRQPQKHATSVITSTFFLRPLCRAARPAGDGIGCSIPPRRAADPTIPACHVTQRVRVSRGDEGGNPPVAVLYADGEGRRRHGYQRRRKIQMPMVRR
jgi:hypothetical protein